MHKDVAKLLKELREQGWEEAPSRSKHIKIRHPEFGLYSLPHSPGERRWKQNLLADLRRLERRARDRRAS